MTLRNLLFLTILFATNLHAQRITQPLKVSENQRFLVTADGKPFFWTGDTAWELFHRLETEEAEIYLSKREEQGFNVVQAVILAELDGLHTPNANGDKPFSNFDPMVMNEDYFKHVDLIINKAAEHRIYIALLPTWGDKLYQNSWGVGPEIFNEKNAAAFGEWLGKRYAAYKNIVWVLDGDRNPRENSTDVAVWQSMAAGIEAGVGGNYEALITVHPQPASPGGSSNWFHQDSWLDFNMHQTGHCANQPTYRKIWHDYDLKPTKPTLDGEPLYEDHPNCFNAKKLGYSDAADIRRIMYWNIFAGGFGQTYGCHDVWQMYDLDKKGINEPLRPWHKALDLPMANQMKYLKGLMLSRPFLTRIPDLEMVIDEQIDDESFVIATRDSEGTYAMVYFPTGKSVKADLSKLNGETLKVTWYDPRTGTSFSSDEITAKSSVLLTPPSSGKGQDWVLVVDDAATKFTKPGVVN
jgi:hypothetical protein